MVTDRAPVRTLILGAAGRDFHLFNMVYRDDVASLVVAFTATQIPGIAGRRYPASLAGALYPDGIPIEPESELEALIQREQVQRVVFAYSDVTHLGVMHLASRALALGADFNLIGPARTMLTSARPVIAISAVRTGAGKSQISRWLSDHLSGRGQRVAVLRHPMPYGELARQRVQHFRTMADLDAARCTAEEREEYEPHLARGHAVFAGVDYGAILALAEAESDIIIWEGGNNDWPFIAPDLHIVVADSLRPDHAARYHPGETVARMADLIVVNKVDSASSDQVSATIAEMRALNATAPIIEAASPVRLDDAARVAGRRVIVVEDGPTITHGGMAHGAGYVAARAAGAAAIVDPRASATPQIQAIYRAYPHIGPVLPAVGYDPGQLQAMADTLNRAEADLVVVATPIDLAGLITLEKPAIRARYGFEDGGEPRLGPIIDRFLASRLGGPAPLG
jgi:predicted GTPase